MLSPSGWSESILVVLGLVVAARWILYILLDILAAFRTFVWARLKQHNLALTYGGKWAVVTGCTDGIGKEYARQLARRDMNILLISRNIDKLTDVQQLIKEESPNVETELVQVDFSHGRAVYSIIAPHLEGKDIGILINNVGVITKPPVHFGEVNDEDIWSHVNVNVASVVAMTHLVLARMVAKGNGAIVNISSILSCQPTPYLAMYSATKAFVDFFSETLLWECRGSGVTVQTLRPGYVATNMTSYSKYIRESNTLVPTAEAFVSSALPTLGHTGRTTGYWVHGLQQFFVENMLTRAVCMFVFDLWNKLLKKETNKPETTKKQQ